MADEFDYIIIGAGSAGCVLADRLSAFGSKRVLVLEAGEMDDWIWFHIPVGYLYAINNPRADWMFRTDPSPGLLDRSLIYPRGKVIGGSSAINGMIYMRGQAADYDHWRQLGLEGWGWDDMLPLFMAQEDHAAPPNDFHRRGGQLRVDYQRTRWKILDAFIEAADSVGIPKSGDFNSGDNFGVGYFQVTQKNGVRWSAARGFLKPALRRPNVKLETAAHVERIMIENNRAVGVRYYKGDFSFEAKARSEVILCAGAINSPHILELSGIGDGARLSALGIETIRHAPGVGENLQDHLQLRPIYKVANAPTINEQYAQAWRRPLMGLEYALFRKGALSMAPSQVGAFAYSSDDHATPNLEFHVQPLSLEKFGDELHNFPAITVSVCNLRPTSRGAVHAKSADPFAPPSIQPNYLDTDEDCRVAVEALHLVRQIMAAEPLAPYAPQEYLPGPEVSDATAVLKAARQIGSTIFHPSCTAKMGVASDPMAVVDQRLQVMGVERLRVADASIMPSITSGNTNAPTMAIAEKAARMILHDRG